MGHLLLFLIQNPRLFKFSLAPNILSRVTYIYAHIYMDIQALGFIHGCEFIIYLTFAILKRAFSHSAVPTTKPELLN